MCCLLIPFLLFFLAYVLLVVAAVSEGVNVPKKVSKIYYCAKCHKELNIAEVYLCEKCYSRPFMISVVVFEKIDDPYE